jgi:hypothetical protein
MMTRATTRLAAATLAAVLLAAACGSSAPTPGPVTTQPPATAASAAPTGAPGSSDPGASAAPTQIVPQPSGGWDVTAGTAPPVPHEAPALEALLPASLRAATFAKASYSGASMPTDENDQTKPTFDLLRMLGKQPADLAFATAADARLNDMAQATNALPVFVIAYQVQGTSADDLMAALLAVAEKYATKGFEKGTASVGGQTLTTYVDKSVPQAGTNYMVPRGDVLFVIQTPDSGVAAEALGALK